MKSAETLYALTSKAVALLESAGDAEAALLLGRVSVGLQEPERWSLSGRAVDAYPAVLITPADLILRLRSDSSLRERIRGALAASFDTADRVLRDVTVVLDDIGAAQASDAASTVAHPYRSAPDPDALPHPGLLAEAASLVAREAGAPEAADLLHRCRLVAETVASQDPERRSTVRVCVLASLQDLARLSGNRKVRDDIVSAVRAVVQGPRRSAGDVTFGPDWISAKGAGRPQRPAQNLAEVLRDLLAARGMGSVVVQSDEAYVRLVVSDAGRIGIVDIGGTDSASVACVQIEPDAPDPAQAARWIEAALRKR